jgi:MFS transporter, SP family, sugar:H+ symporter
LSKLTPTRNSGTLTGALFGSPIADRFGRRTAMSFASLIVCVGVAIQISSTTVWQQFAMGRFVTGLGIGSLSANVPLYQSELAPKQIRGTLGELASGAVTSQFAVGSTYHGSQSLLTSSSSLSVFSSPIALGKSILPAALLETSLNTSSRSIGLRDLDGPASWRTLVGLTMVFAAIIGFGILFMPESPRWLMKKGKHDKARAALARVRGVHVDESKCQLFISKCGLQEVTVRRTTVNQYVEHDYNEILEAIAIDDKLGTGTVAGA